MDLIKEAFQKAKQDISDLRAQIIELSNQISELRSLVSASFQQTNQQTDKPTQEPLDLPIIIEESSTFQHKTQTNQHETSTNKLNERSNLPLYPLKPSNLNTSKGNEGVPTNRQTNQQTDRQTFSIDNSTSMQNSLHQQVRLIEVSKAFQSLDSLKQDLKQQFKSLTKQEFIFFSTVYQLESEGFVVDYPLLASKLTLSESSMRDYTLKIIRKGLPLIKTKIDNKKVILSISPDLKKIASLESILSLKKL
ncbi:MAG: hypothetical protein AABX66_03920 [Nanoarchaeota archaeon]